MIAPWKRYWLFSGARYYPNGGMDDFVGDFDTTEEAKASVTTTETGDQWAEIYDSETREPVFFGYWRGRRNGGDPFTWETPKPSKQNEATTPRKQELCPKCNGDRVVEDTQEGAGYGGVAFVTCNACGGTGWAADEASTPTTA